MTDNNKAWQGLNDCLSDHMIIARQLPNIMYAYLSGYNAETIESIMLTVNSVNDCAYCTGLHGELARLSGISPEDAETLNGCSTMSESLAVRNTSAVRFARAFAEADGQNIPKLLKDAGVAEEEQSNMIALAYFLYWGSYGGNTINTFIYGKRLNLFGLFFTSYYGPLYLLILATTMLLKVFPSKVPGLLYTLL